MRSMPPRRPRHPASVIRTSYQVGRPWMLDGNMLRAATGTPIFRIALANSSLADAEPEPLTLANLTTKSLTAASGTIPAPCTWAFNVAPRPQRLRSCGLLRGLPVPAGGSGLGHLDQRL